MSAPYFVAAGDMSGSFYREARTISEAIATALDLKGRGYLVAVYGEDYDAESDPRGFRCCNTGLTEEDRERIEEAGL